MARNESTEVATTVDTQQSQDVALITDRELLSQWAERATAIPSESDGGTEDILRKIFEATSWAQIDEPWRTTDVDDIVGKPLRLTKVVRRPSTFESGLGVFLIVHLHDPKDKKDYVKTTGSIAIVGQLAQLYYLGATAITVRWCKAQRPTEKGFYPQHLEIIDAHVPERGAS